MEPVSPSHRAPCDWGHNNVDGFLIQPKTVHCSSNSSFKWKGVPACLPASPPHHHHLSLALSHPPPPSSPLPPLSTTTTNPQSTRCIVKKWEGTLEPSCSMKVGCSVCLLMRWKEDGSEKWNKVKEHIKKNKLYALRRGKTGGAVETLSPLFETSFEVQVRNWEK